MRLAPSWLDGLQTGGQSEVYPMGPHILMDHTRHLVVQRGQHLVRQLNGRDVHSGVDQILHHLHADEAAAHHQGPGWLGLGQISLDGVAVRHVPQREYIGQNGTREVRAHGRRTGREHQFVVAFLIGLSAGELEDRHNLAGPIDGRHFALYAHFYVEPLLHGFRRLQEQLIPFLDGAADVIGQPAVCKRDVFSPFKQEDLRLFIQASQTGGGAGAAATPPMITTFIILFLPNWGHRAAQTPHPASSEDIHRPAWQWRRSF